MNESQFKDARDEALTAVSKNEFTMDQLQKYAEQTLSGAVIELLQTNRLFGEVLIQIPRYYNTNLNGAMGFKWSETQLNLTINPMNLLISVRYWHELIALLKHEVLHVVWQHPLRYQGSINQNNVALATDVSVNQYLAEVPRGTVTLKDLEKLLDKKLPQNADSGTYLQIIQSNKINSHDDGKKGDNKLDTDQRFKKEKQISGSGAGVSLDVHDGWSNNTEQHDSLTQQTAQLKQILSQAWQSTPDRDRGLLPGKLKQQLEQVDQTTVFNWKQLIKRSIGNLPQGKRPSYSRFNRRQPLRMDLPGQVTNLVTKIDVFVDNSGSMGDKEISFLLNQIKGIVEATETQTTVFTFDAKVHSDESYELQSQNQIQFKRIGGGGTSFQSIFTYLKANQRTNNDTLAIILTDGWGEESINNYHFTNVIWVLTTSIDQFSIKHSIGKLTTVVDDVNYKRVVGIK
ncbi:hypothetical protein LOOC260_101480 [Paucilactobacillus hokkaidonensis JCM 18461]|uniref:Peptidase n=2 Tax=Paucilactobacillus hokkaidonensis TaxID=1193095 RepID=A0A0A1GWI0_9LACO|nr:VWA-like domain-containing protein [Paucilactobacillus hokkaidonensis]KRO09838.1 hypothetical protein IV59_GL000306 [Paucilactobacillus hokkaidonensis]BAP84726.1 hypothetical protein LOOC260_101480 [Paucilactobacillus hokkaidonensis JCM 18461]